MCTGIVHLDAANRSALLAFVRDEDRTRPTRAAGRWWADAPQRIGGRDERAGGTWLAVEDGPHPRIAFVQNRRDQVANAPLLADRISRGSLPGHVLDHGDLTLDEASLRRVEPFVLVLIDPSPGSSRSWNWDGTHLATAVLADGWHLVTSHGLDQAELSARHRRWLPQFAAAPLPHPTDPRDAPPHEAWGPWIELLDGREAIRGDDSSLIIVGIDDHPDFGTVGASLVALAADEVRLDVNPTHAVDPVAWRHVELGVLDVLPSG